MVIGAGISGCATAAHLLRLEPALKVTLLEHDHVGSGSTSRSMAAFRHQWSLPIHIAFSRYAAGQGLSLPLRPAKRYLYHSRPLNTPRVAGWPLVVSPGGAHFRPSEGNTLLLAWEHRPDPLQGKIEAAMLWECQDTIEPGFGTDLYGYGIEILMELAPLVPMLEERAALASVTCGWYQVTDDHKAILSEDPRLPGLFVAAGFSGHGIMHGPATGRTLAELVLNRPTGLAPREEIARHFGLAALLEGRRREPAEQMVL